MMDEEHAMIRFVAETRIPGTDPSYHLPAFYELFARWGRVRSVPSGCAPPEASRELFHKAAHLVTGLSADRTDFDGKALPNWDGTPGIFAYDSWRTVSNIAFDYAWFAQDPRQPELTSRIQNFLHSEGLRSFTRQVHP